MFRVEQPSGIVDAGLLVVEAAQRKLLVVGRIEAQLSAELMVAVVAGDGYAVAGAAGAGALVVVAFVACGPETEAYLAGAAEDADAAQTAGTFERRPAPVSAPSFQVSKRGTWGERTMTAPNAPAASVSA